MLAIILLIYPQQHSWNYRRCAGIRTLDLPQRKPVALTHPFLTVPSVFFSFNGWLVDLNESPLFTRGQAIRGHCLLIDGYLPCSCNVDDTPFELLKGGFKVSGGVHILVGT